MKPRFAGAMLALFLVVNAGAATTNDLARQKAAGQELAQQLRALRPESSFTNRGKLVIRASRKQVREVGYECRVIVGATNWVSHYSATDGTNALPGFSVEHRDGQANRYIGSGTNNLSANQTMISFAGSDFWLADLGLEFFQWPDQRVLKWEMRRSMGCKVLESRNPDASTTGYSRVVSWIHEETGNIVQAEAYDTKGELLKEFRPTEVQKVNGQRQLKEMEIENIQTGSTTKLVFYL